MGNQEWLKSRTRRIKNASYERDDALQDLGVRKGNDHGEGR